jgi:hypothetical protein
MSPVSDRYVADDLFGYSTFPATNQSITLEVVSVCTEAKRWAHVLTLEDVVDEI